MSPNRMAIKTAPTNVHPGPNVPPELESEHVKSRPPRLADIDGIHAGDSAELECTVTDAQIDAFAEFSQDDNPLHMDDRFAQRCGFAGRVAHGMVAFSLLSRLIGTQLPGPGALWISQEVHFAAPVLVGDTLRAKVLVQNVSKSARVVVLQTEVVCCQSDLPVLRGTAKVRIPEIDGPSAS
ncbi:MAG: MaoC family dehydratase [Aureliella sp.]